MAKEKSAFTLVELLVVIAIIGILVGLTLPAVNYAVESGRKAKCLNQQRSWGQAIAAFESDKGHLPGRISIVRTNTGGQVPVSWATRLLPYIEKGNIWERVLNDPDISDNPDNPSRYAIELEIATCPSDPRLSDLKARSSYVMNCGIWDRQFGDNPSAWNDLRANGVAHFISGPASQVKVDSGYISKNDGLTQTLLLSENINATTWVTLEEGLHGMVWTLQDEWLPPTSDLTEGRQYQINRGQDRFIDDQLIQMSLGSDAQRLESIARPSSNHSGGVNAIFCDTHARFLSDEMHPRVYAQLLTCSQTQARHPGNGGSNWLRMPIPAQLDTILGEGDY